MNFSCNFLASNWTDLDPAMKHELIELDQNEFPNPWPTQNWDSFLKESAREHKIFMLIDDSLEKARIIGLALFFLEPVDKRAHLLKILCLPNYRQKGLGHLLLNKSHDYLKNRCQIECIELEVAQDNFQAIALYLKLGYIKMRSIKNFYTNGSSADVMQVSLGGSAL